MNNQKHHAFRRTSKHQLRTKQLAATCLLLGLAAIPFASHAQSSWIGGTDPDWNGAPFPGEPAAPGGAVEPPAPGAPPSPPPGGTLPTT